MSPKRETFLAVFGSSRWHVIKIDEDYSEDPNDPMADSVELMDREVYYTHGQAAAEARRLRGDATPTGELQERLRAVRQRAPVEPEQGELIGRAGERGEEPF